VQVPGSPDVRERRQEVVDPIRVEQLLLHVLGQAQVGNLRPPQLVESGRWAVVGESLGDGCSLDQGVVRPERHRAVAGRAPHRQAPPGDTLLPHVHRDDGRLGGPDVEPTVLGQDVVGTDRVELVLGHPAGAVGAAVLLVGHGKEDQVAAGTKARIRQASERHGLRGGEVQHVDGTTTPDLAVDQLGAERVSRPAVRVHGHHVGVAHQAQRGCTGVRALDTGHQRDPPRRGFIALDVEARCREVALERVRVADLLARLGGAVVHAGVADQLLEQFDRGASRPGRIVAHAENLGQGPPPPRAANLGPS